MANTPTVKAPRKIADRAVKVAEQASFAFRFLVRKVLRASARTLAFESLDLRRYTRSARRPAKNAHSRSWCLRFAARRNRHRDTFLHVYLRTKGWAQSFRFRSTVKRIVAIRQYERTGALRRQVSSSIWLTRKSATSVREMSPFLH